MHPIALLATALLAVLSLTEAATIPFSLAITPNADQSVTVAVGTNRIVLPASFVADFPMLQRLFLTPASNSPGSTATISVSITMNNDGSVTASVQGTEGTVTGTIPAATVSQIRSAVLNLIGVIDPVKAQPRSGKTSKESNESKRRDRHH